MQLDESLPAQQIGWNMLLARPDGESFHLDWLPNGTNFMVYPENINDPEDISQLIVNLKLITQQKWCGRTWPNVIQYTNDKSQGKNFKENSKQFRGSVLKIDGPVWEHRLEVKQNVFLAIPTWYVK